MAKSSGGGGRAGRGFSSGQSRAAFNTLSQGRSVTVRTPGGLVTIENAPRGVRKNGIEFVATGVRGFGGSGPIDSRATFTASELRSFFRESGITPLSRLR